MQPQQQPQQSVSKVLRDGLVLISFLVLFAGLVSLDAYYSFFGIKYQSLGFDATHAIYRGVSLVYDYPAIMIPYVVVASWLAMNEIAEQRRRHALP